MLHFRSTTGGPSDLAALLFIFLTQLLVFTIANVYLITANITNTLAGNLAACIFRGGTARVEAATTAEAGAEAEAEDATMAEAGASTEASSEPKTIDFFSNTFSNTGIPR